MAFVDSGRCCHFVPLASLLQKSLSQWVVPIVLSAPSIPVSKGSPALWFLVSSVAAAATANSLQLCPTLCDLIDGSSLGSPVPGILQARTLEWVAISFSCMKVKSESEVAQ